MASFDLIDFAVVALMLGGLAAVLVETLLKNPRSLVEMMDDSRRFAEAPISAPAARRSAAAADRIAANQDHPRLAA